MSGTPQRPPQRPVVRPALAAAPGSGLQRAAALPEASALSVELAIDNFFALLRRLLIQPLKETVVLAERMEGLRQSGRLNDALAECDDFIRLVDATERVAVMAERILALGEVLGEEAVTADERLLLADVAAHAANALAEKAGRRRVGIALDAGQAVLAPVYGSARWLTRAFVDLLAPMVAAAPAGSHVVLQLRQVGYHQLVTGHMGGLRPPTGSIDLLARRGESVQSEIASAVSNACLDRALARGLVELHGGALRRDVLDDGEEQFTLTLPTGELAPQRQADCAHCPHALQSEQFARDLAELLNAQSGAVAPLNGSTS